MNDFTPANYEEFLKLAQEGTIVPVIKRVMADLLTPVAAYIKMLRLSPFSFLLESIEGGEKVARYSFLGFDPHVIVRSRSGRVIIESATGREETDQPMLDVLRRLSGRYIPVRVPDVPPFSGGAVGYMSYDAVRWFENIPDKNPDSLDLDDAVMMFFSRLMAFDHVRHQVHIIVNVFTEGKIDHLEREYQKAISDIENIEARLEDLDVLAGDEGALDTADQLFGLAAEHAAADDFQGAGILAVAGDCIHITAIIIKWGVTPFGATPH